MSYSHTEYSQCSTRKHRATWVIEYLRVSRCRGARDRSRGRTHRTRLKRTSIWRQSLGKVLWGSGDSKGRGLNVLEVKSSLFNKSKSSRLAVVWVIQKEDSSLSTALATPASSTVIHAAILWAGYHRNCPSQTRQQQHCVCCWENSPHPPTPRE